MMPTSCAGLPLAKIKSSCPGLAGASIAQPGGSPGQAGRSQWVFYRVTSPCVAPQYLAGAQDRLRAVKSISPCCRRLLRCCHPHRKQPGKPEEQEIQREENPKAWYRPPLFFDDEAEE